MYTDDYALEPLPHGRKIGWFALTVMRFGQFATLAQLLVGSTLGVSMSVSRAFLALFVGISVLLLVAIPMGMVGQKTGLATSRLTRQVGLGKTGSLVFSLISGISVMGWFGVQNALFAQGVRALAGGGALWIWILACGVVVTIVVAGGILYMGWAAYVAVPLFIVLLGMGLLDAFAKVKRHHVLPLSGTSHESLAMAITIVVGSFILGAVLSPDMTRFQKNIPDVAKQSLVSFVVGIGLFSGIGVVAGHLLHEGNITATLAIGGVLGWVIFVASTMKVSDWDIYGASLALVNGLELLKFRNVSRTKMSIIVGLLGTIAGLLGIVNQFVPFLTLMGVAIPPVAAIVIIDYFRFGSSTTAKFAVLVAWLAGFGCGRWFHWGVPALNSLLVAAVLYWMIGTVIYRIPRRNVPSGVNMG